jgi:hypothetical protein
VSAVTFSPAVVYTSSVFQAQISGTGLSPSYGKIKVFPSSFTCGSSSSVTVSATASCASGSDLTSTTAVTCGNGSSTMLITTAGTYKICYCDATYLIATGAETTSTACSAQTDYTIDLGALTVSTTPTAAYFSNISVTPATIYTSTAFKVQLAGVNLNPTYGKIKFFPSSYTCGSSSAVTVYASTSCSSGYDLTSTTGITCGDASTTTKLTSSGTYKMCYCDATYLIASGAETSSTACTDQTEYTILVGTVTVNSRKASSSSSAVSSTQIFSAGILILFGTIFLF